MLIPKRNRRDVYKFLFKEGVLYAEKDYNLAKHPELDVPNLHVIKLMQSFKSKEFVKEQFAWRHYYWFLTDAGIAYLREYLNLPSEIVPATLKKTARAAGDRRPPLGGDRPPRRDGGGFGGRDGYREGYRSGPREGFGRGGAPDKVGAPGSYQPQFGGGGGGFGRGQ